MPLLTVFTPAYNRKHTINRTYESLLRQTCKDFQWLIIDDGSSDGTREWVASLGEAYPQPLPEGRGALSAYDWMGRSLSPDLSPEGERSADHFIIEVPFADGEGTLRIEYVYKPNGGLYTGYNVAYDLIDTELCVCIDSDDYMPDDAVEIIKRTWEGLSADERSKVGGILGLDYDVTTGGPLGGLFPVADKAAWVQDLHHAADSKPVFRTMEIKRYAPQIGFEGEKDFNPHYMQMQVYDKLPMMVLNKNLCWVEYQFGADSMSEAIFKQYKRSPRSFAQFRLKELGLRKHQDLKNQMRIYTHYVSSCIFSGDKDWLSKSPHKLMALLCAPLGVMLNIYIRYKAK